MECREALPFVSLLHDGELIPPEFGQHIAACLSCRQCLEEYSAMGAELRLLACLAGAKNEEDPSGVLRKLPFHRSWTQTWTAGLALPRFVVVLGIGTIIGLSLGLALVRAQTHGHWFRYELVSREMGEGGPRSFFSGQAGTRQTFLFTTPRGAIGAQIEVVGIRDGIVRLATRVHRFEQLSSLPSVRVGENLDVARTLETGPVVQYSYIPGETLTIPVEAGGTLELTGQVLADRPVDISLAPKPNELVLNHPALARDGELLTKGQNAGGVSASGEDPGVAIYVPGEGLFALALRPFGGAMKGEAYWGHARFELGGKEYLLFSASPITGGQQPRQIWIYRNPNFSPSKVGLHQDDRAPFTYGVDELSNLFKYLRE